MPEEGKIYKVNEKKVNSTLNELKSIYDVRAVEGVDEARWEYLCGELVKAFGNDSDMILAFIKPLKWEMKIFIDDIYDELTEKFPGTELHSYLNDLSEKVLQYFIDLSRNTGKVDDIND